MCYKIHPSATQGAFELKLPRTPTLFLALRKFAVHFEAILQAAIAGTAQVMKVPARASSPQRKRAAPVQTMW
jgi:hypothetical protein